MRVCIDSESVLCVSSLRIRAKKNSMKTALSIVLWTFSYALSLHRKVSFFAILLFECIAYIVFKLNFRSENTIEIQRVYSFAF